MLSELLAGRLPFDLADRTPREMERIIVEQEPERPSVVARRTPALPVGSSRLQSASKAQWADLDVLCLTAMHKDPARRYASVEALIRDVGHYLTGEPLEARPDTLRYRAGMFVRRNWRAVTADSAIHDGSVPGERRRSSRAGRQPSRRHPHRSRRRAGAIARSGAGGPG